MTEYYQIDLPISKKKIYVRDWNVREDNSLAKKLQSIDKTKNDYIIQENKIIMEFVKEHLKSSEIFDTLNILDFRYIQIALHNGSKGNIKDFKFTCKNEDHEGKKCSAFDQYQDGRLDIVNDINFPENIKETQVEISEDLSVSLIPLPLVKEIEFIEKMLTDETYNLNDFKYDSVIASINTILYKGKILDKSFEERKEYIGDLKPKDLKSIVKQYNELNSDLIITKKNKCIKCGKESSISIGGFSFFI